MSPSIHSSSSLITFLSCFLLLFTAPAPAASFNITKLLDRYQGYGTFNSLLSQTKLASEINRRRTITVLAVPDEQISGLASKGVDTATRVLSNHVILDYYDMEKLRNLKKGTTLLTTLYQASGEASHQTGFLNVTDMKDGQVRFGSATKGAGLDVTLRKLVAAQPYNISVLEVTGPIHSPGVDVGPAGPPLKPVAPPPTPAKKKPSPSPAESPDVAESPDEAEAPSPAEGPAEGPADAPADAPADSPADAPAEGSTADGESDAEAPSSNKAVTHKGFAVSASLGLMVALVSFFLTDQ